MTNQSRANFLLVFAKSTLFLWESMKIPFHGGKSYGKQKQQVGDLDAVFNRSDIDYH